VRPALPTVEELRQGPLLFPKSASEDYEREIRGSIYDTKKGEELKGVMFRQLSLSSRKGFRLPTTSHLEPFFFISYY